MRRITFSEEGAAFFRRLQTEVGEYRKFLDGSEGTTPREIIGEPGFAIPYKRCWYWLEKWTRANLYEYGVSLDLGWMTPEGMAHDPEIQR